MTKTTPIGREKFQQTVVDKDQDTKSVTDAPTTTSVFERQVGKNELPNPQVDEENNSCFLRHESKDCRPKQLRTGFEQNVTSLSDEECVNNELQDTISKEDKCEEAISDEPCDTDDDQFETYDIKLITYQVLFTENIKHKIY